jgi:DNA (cytosine-5)-methyltransferase 1
MFFGAKGDSNVTLKAIDVFAGAGGLSLGLKEAGWSVEAAVEYDAVAMATHKHNFPETTHLVDDVRGIDFKRFRGFDLVAGGPPCQPFSVSGKRLGSFDVRDMVPEFVRAVAEAKPRAFLMENVAGLTAARFDTYLSDQIVALRSLGYVVFSKVLNAANYGVAQRRKRLFLVGIRQDQDRAFSFPESTHEGTEDSPFVSVSNVLEQAPDDIPNTARVVYCKNPVLRKSPFAGMLFNGKGRPLENDGLAHTIPASAGGNRTHILDRHNLVGEYHAQLLSGAAPRKGTLEGVRRLTVAESARIQSFPDFFHFVGRQSSRYSQVGNAVPPKLAQAVCNSVRIALT